MKGDPMTTINRKQLQWQAYQDKLPILQDYQLGNCKVTFHSQMTRETTQQFADFINKTNENLPTTTEILQWLTDHSIHFSVHWTYCKELPVLQQIKSIYGILSLKRYLKCAGRITLDNCTIFLPIIPDPVKQELTSYMIQAQKEHNFDIFTTCNLVLKHRILPNIRWHICPYRKDLKTYKDRWTYNYNSFRCIHYIRKQLKQIRKEIRHDQNTDQTDAETKPETHA